MSARVVAASAQAFAMMAGIKHQTFASQVLSDGSFLLLPSCGMIRRFELTDQQFALVSDRLPAQARSKQINSIGGTVNCFRVAALLRGNWMRKTAR